MFLHIVKNSSTTSLIVFIYYLSRGISLNPAAAFYNVFQEARFKTCSAKQTLRTLVINDSLLDILLRQSIFLPHQEELLKKLMFRLVRSSLRHCRGIKVHISPTRSLVRRKDIGKLPGKIFYSFSLRRKYGASNIAISPF